MANKVIGSIPYSLALKVVNPNEGEENLEKKIGASLQERETITLDLLADHMSDHGTPFTKGVIKGVLTDMVSCTLELLKGGYGVDLTGLAKFSLRAQTNLVDTVQDFNAQTDIKKILIRTSIPEAATQFVNTDVDFEYVMTREQQAAAKKAAKAALPQDENSGSGNNGGNGGGNGEITE